MQLLGAIHQLGVDSNTNGMYPRTRGGCTAVKGLTLESGKHYSQSVEDSFHVSMAALELEGDVKEVTGSPLIKVMVQHQKKEFLLCSMIQGSFLIQQQLDLDFTEGEEVTFYLEGNGIVHLTGYLVQEKSFGVGEEPILGSPPDSSEDGMEVSGDDSDGQDDTFPTLQDLAKSDDIDSEDEGEDWIPDKKVTKSIPKRKLEGDVKKSKKSRVAGDTASEDFGEGDDWDSENDPAEELQDLFKDIEANTDIAEKDNVKTEVDLAVGAGDASKKKKKRRKKKKQQVKVKVEPSESSETPADETEEIQKSSQRLSDMVELAAAIALFPGKIVTLQVLKCSRKRSVRRISPEEFDTAMSCLKEFGQKLSVHVPRCSKPVVVFLKQFPHLIKEDVWNSIVTKENYTLQFYKKCHSKISPNVRKNCINMMGQDHFELVLDSDGAGAMA